MSQLKRLLCVGLMVSILGLMTGASLGAAEPRATKASWDNLKALPQGKEIQVVLNNAESYRGLLQTVTEEAIVVRTAGGEQTFTRQSILRVSTKGESHRGRNAVIGAIVGLAGGAATVAALCQGTTSCTGTGTAALVVGGGFGAPVGAVAGAVIPTGGWRDIYRAR